MLASRVGSGVAAIPRAPAVLRGEQAGSQQTERFGWDGEIPHPSTVIQEHTPAGKRHTELYDWMLETDTKLAAEAEKRAEAVLGLPRYIVPAGGEPIDLEIAEFCRVAVRQIRSWSTNLRHLLTAIPTGLAVEELIWSRGTLGDRKDAIFPVEAFDRPRWRFGFNSDRSLFVRRLNGTKEPATAGKFLVYAHGTKDNPWGDALLDRCHFGWWSKRHIKKYWANFLERWAAPSLLGRYTPTEDDTVDDRLIGQLEEAIEMLQTEYGAIFPNTLTIDPMQVSQSGGASYDGYCQMTDQDYALLFNGEVETSGASRQHGSFASKKVSKQIRFEKIKIDSHDLGTFVTDTLLRWICLLNFGAENERHFSRFWIDARDAEDKEMQREGAQLLLDLDEPVTRRHLYSICGAPEPGPADEVVRKRKAAPSAPPPPAPAGAEDDETEEDQEQEAA